MRLLILLFLTLVPFAAEAQQPGVYTRVEETINVGTAYFVHALPGQATKQIFMWGTIPAPGLYEVGVDTSLEKLITLAGGPPGVMRIRSDRRTTYLRLYRPEGNSRALLYEITMRDFVQSPSSHPPLADGDVVEFETIQVRGLQWRDVLTIGSATLGIISTLLLLRDRL